MTDYKNLKLIASSSPHIRSNEDTRSIMLDVIIALLPALAWSVYCFGWKALLLTAVSVVSCVFFEWAYRKLMKKSCMVGDLSAVVTGILLSFVCPVDLPWWVIIIGAFFSIVVVKQLYGGIGCNFLNPALAGRAFLLASYATWMTSWAIPQIRPDVTSAATPMAIMKEGTEEAFTTLMSNYSIGDMFLGKVGGSMGEVSALMLLIGGLYLIWRKVINWQTPVAYIATVAVLTVLFPKAGGAEYMLYSIFGGGLFLGAQKIFRHAELVDGLQTEFQPFIGQALGGPQDVVQIGSFQACGVGVRGAVARHEVHTRAAQGLCVKHGPLQSGIEFLFPAGQAGQAAFPGLPVAGRQVEQGLREAVALQSAGQILGCEFIGKKILHPVEALIRRRAEAVEEGQFREHHGQIGGKTGHGGPPCVRDGLAGSGSGRENRRA